MDFVLDLLQGVGLAAAIGVRPLLPVLLAGALAIGDAGLDFEGTDFSFLEEAWFLIAVAVLITALEVLGARRGPDAPEPRPLVYALAAIAVVLGVLVAAGSLADRDHSILPGVVLGAAAAVLGFVAARSLLTRVRRRLDAETARALPVYAEGAALTAAGLSILFPPLAVLVLGALAWLLLGSRRREGEKYAGLRVLR
jgi:Na+-transporting NADH:ubiquinone oxidoreductase subunit NqrE